MLRLEPHPEAAREVGPLGLTESWLVDIREDGAVAFRTLPAWTAGEPGSGIETAASFAELDYGAANLEVLRERATRPTAALDRFLEACRIRYHRPAAGR